MYILKINAFHFLVNVLANICSWVNVKLIVKFYFTRFSSSRRINISVVFTYIASETFP